MAAETGRPMGQERAGTASAATCRGLATAGCRKHRQPFCTRGLNQILNVPSKIVSRIPWQDYFFRYST
jgi:hypothetical protein